MVAAGPSTCCDEFVAAHHRRLEGRVKGLTSVFLPAINYPARNPLPQWTFAWRGALDKKYSMAAKT